MAPGIGTVTGFSFERGLGEVTALDGTVLPFHCTAIADGTRDIAVGTVVAFEVAAGPHGRWEASGLVGVGGSAP